MRTLLLVGTALFLMSCANLDLEPDVSANELNRDTSIFDEAREDRVRGR